MTPLLDARSTRLALVAAAVAMVVLVAVDVTGPVRTVAAVTFLLVAPGLALVRLLHLDHAPLAVALTVALSLAVDLAVAQVLMGLDAFTALNGIAAVAAVTAAAAALDRRPQEVAAS